MIKIKLLVILSLAILITSCGRQQPSSDRTVYSIENETPLQEPDVNGAVTGDWVVQQELADAEKLNPIVSNDATATEISGYIFDRLILIDRATYELTPSVAKALPEESDDHLTYTFEVRDDVKFSDGKPLTAEDVLFTMKVVMNPFTDAQPTRNYFLDLENVELVNGDKYKIRFKLSQPYFRAIYSIGDMDILPKHILDKDNVTDQWTIQDFLEAAKSFDPAKYPAMQKYADFINSQDVSRSPNYVIGSGPYKLENWQTGQAITLVRNDNYWNKENIPSYPNKLIFRTIQDQTAALTAAKNKEIDNMYVIRDLDFVENLKTPEQFGLKKAIVSRPTYTYIAWNQNRPFFADKKVRWALSHLIDRKLIIEKLMYGLAVPIQSHIFYKSDYLNSDLPPIEFNIEEAKRLLDEAGWIDSDGDGIRDKTIDGRKVDFKFTFINNQNPSRKQTLLVFIDALKQAGIQADIQDYEWSVFLDKTSKHEFDAFYGGWVLTVTPPDPYQIFHSSQSHDKGSNYTSYNNPESDRLIEENRVTFDDVKRKEMLHRWQEIIYEDQPYTFLWSPAGKYIYSDRYRNTRWYAYPYPHWSNEWWVPSDYQRYKN